MVRSGILLFVISTIVVCTLFEEAHALKCWTCSSSMQNEEFCGDPFDPSIISDQQRRISYDECKKPPGQLNPYAQTSVQKAVCKKLVQTVNGKNTVSRSCTWENVDTPKNGCASATTPSHIKTEFCETCETDACNGTVGQIAPIAIVALLLGYILWPISTNLTNLYL